MYQPLGGNSLFPYRMASTVLVYFLVFRYSCYLVSSAREIPASNCTYKLQQNTSHVQIIPIIPWRKRVLLIEPRANTKIYISIEYLICYTQGGV